jgi:hypothetical protein
VLLRFTYTVNRFHCKLFKVNLCKIIYIHKTITLKPFFLCIWNIQSLYTNGYTGWHIKTGTFEKPNKNWRNPRKKFIDRNWTITTCLLRDSNPDYQCLKITSCGWRPPPRMHSFTATTHFKSSRSIVSLCVCCMLYRIRLRRIQQSMQHTQAGHQYWYRITWTHFQWQILKIMRYKSHKTRGLNHQFSWH